MAPAKDLKGQVFGSLTVIEKTEKRTKTGDVIWKCRCVCNKEILVASKHLNQGRRSCGCLNIIPRYELKGKKFGRLTVLTKTDERRHGKVQWLCLCECGTTILAATCNLVKNETKSCGCYQREQSRRNVIGIYKGNIKDGTNIKRIQSNKLPKHNTSGHVGVTWNSTRNRWTSRIMFQGKSYTLGYFDNKEEAIKARKEAEEKYFKTYLESNGYLKDKKETS